MKRRCVPRVCDCLRLALVITIASLHWILGPPQIKVRCRLCGNTCWTSFVSPLLCRQRWGRYWFTSVCSVYLLSSGFYRAGRGLPTKHETLTQCWADVGPPSTSLSQLKASSRYNLYATCISPMPGHCVWCWLTFKQHWTLYTMLRTPASMKYWLGLNGYWPAPTLATI